MVVIDIDGDTTLARFWSSDTARQWCAATYTSNSHSEQEHRFRALFPLSMELSSPSQHKGAYWLIVDRLLADLGLEQLSDNCCLLYTSPSPRDRQKSRMPSSA